MNRYWEKLARLREKDIESITPVMRHVISAFVEPLAQGITQRFADAKTKPGRKTAAISLLYWAHADVLALQTLQTVLDAVSRPQRYQTVAMRIAREVHNELRFALFEAQKPALFGKVQSHIAESPFAYRRSYRQKVMVHAMNKYELMWEEWDNTQLYSVGVFLLDALIETTGIVTSSTYHTRVRGQHRGVTRILPTKEFEDWLQSQHQACAEMRPRMIPMVCPPKPWTALRDGGYLTDSYRSSLVPDTRSGAIHVDRSKDAMPIVYEAVNWLQGTAWEVNNFVLETVAHLWDGGYELPDVRRKDLELPPKAPEGSTPEELSAAKIARRDVRLENEQMKGRRMGAAQTIGLAKRFADRPIWFPYRYDFRGRVYPMSQYLQPQGADLAKGLLGFHEKRVVDAEGFTWLKIHAANSFGVDKVSMTERAQWADDNWDMIESIAADPLANREWYEADAPFQFLAVCDALVRANDGEPVGLPVGVDGSCNGIQHLAAMSRDDKSGSLVNLMPGPVPADIYMKVAESVQEQVEKHITNPKEVKTSKGVVRWTADEVKLMALQWRDFGITRGLAKRPTMILPYNGTPTAIEQYIEDYVRKQVQKTGVNPFGKRRASAIAWLTSVIGPAMRKAVAGPVKVMEWTRRLAKSVATTRDPLVWNTPSGFVVVQAYRETSSRRVKTRLGDKTVKLTLRESTEKYDSDRQRRSLAPNWIHSYDAACLHLTLFSAKLEGLRMGAVHDSYLGHPNDMNRLSEILREEFVKVYADHNRMEELRVDISRMSTATLDDLEEPPALGDLDVRLVKESPYFFA